MKIRISGQVVLFCTSSYLALAQMPVALAQTTGPSIDPGQLEQRFRQSETLSPLPSAPAITIPPTQNFAAPAGAESARFELRNLRVLPAKTATSAPTDALALSENRFADLIEPLKGQSITVAQLFALAEAITARYGQAGYPLSVAIVPPQTIDGGDVRIEVVEGYIDRVVYADGFTPDRPGLFQEAEARLLASRPLRTVDLERFVLVLNGLPGLAISTAFRPSETTPGASTLQVEATRTKGVDASFSIDNRGSAAVGKQQAVASVSLNSFFGWYEQTTVTTALAEDPRELRYISASQQHTVNALGTTLRVSGTKSLSEPSGVSRLIETRSDSETLAFALQHPLLLSRRESLQARIGFTARNSETRQLGATSSQDQVRYADVGVSFSQRLEQGSNQIGLTLSHGLPAFGATDDDSTTKSRTDGRADFTMLQIDAGILRPVTDRLSLQFRASGQWAATGLLSSQEMGLGGAEFGRAYDPSEITGDHGLAGSVELAYALPLQNAVIRAPELFAFYDLGAVWNRNTLNNEPSRRSLASAGGGIRFGRTTDYLSGSVEFAQPLTRVVADEGDSDPRIFFRLTARY